MTEIKSLNAPAIGDEGVKRLFAFCQPKSMKEGDTLFTAGYEQAKRDFHEKLRAEVGNPKPTQNHYDGLSTEENKARVAALQHERRPWWRIS